jgi:hypothetical protein
VASAKNDAEAHKVAGAVALLASMQETLTKHGMLNPIEQASLSSTKGEHLGIWSFQIAQEPLFLALIMRGEKPTEALAVQLQEGLQRIFHSLQK